jgi:hypothetical protein
LQEKAMPWKECNIVEERLGFMARVVDGEKMAGYEVACIATH